MQRGKTAKTEKTVTGHTLSLGPAMWNVRRVSLKKLLMQYMGLNLTREQPVLTLNDIEYAGLDKEFYAVTQKLGLQGEEIPNQAQKIEIEINGVAIALDDEPQFNEFRLQTLESPIYTLPLIYNLNRYKSYCRSEAKTADLNTKREASQYDAAATSAMDRKVVTRDRQQPSSKQVACRMAEKKQALNDFMQDLLPLVHYVPVLRLSVFDQVETPDGAISIHTLLSEESRKHFEILADYLIRQLDDLEGAFHVEY